VAPSLLGIAGAEGEILGTPRLVHEGVFDCVGELRSPLRPCSRSVSDLLALQDVNNDLDFPAPFLTLGGSATLKREHCDMWGDGSVVVYSSAGDHMAPPYEPFLATSAVSGD
jgi:hypothetical protein